MRKTREGFAQEELQHYKKLEAVRAGRIALEREGVGDLGLAEKLDDVEPRPDMDYTELQETFLALAEQEAEHKRRFEMEYESLTS